MKNLFIVSVALGIFSGTTLTVKAQPAVNVERVSTAVPVKKQTKFIDGIEIRPGTAIPDQSVVKIFVEPISVSPEGLFKNDGSDIELCTPAQFKYAQLLDLDVESVTNYSLYNFIEKWWGIPYRYGGATEKGIDCSAFSCTLLYNVYGLILSRTAKSQFEACEKIDRKNLQEGDLVFFHTRRGVSHVGVYLRNGYFTHASTGNGVTISSLDDPYYNKKYIGGGRIGATEVEVVQ